LSYFGGKSKIAKDIANFINRRFVCSISEENKELQNTLQNGLTLHTHTHTHTHYVEPFCGACNVASKIHIKNKILNDKHTYLIEMFKALQNGWIPPKELLKEEYEYIRNNLDENKALSGFVGFGCSFSGIWFSNYAKDNTGRNYCLNAHNSILKKMETLMDAQFTCEDFRNLNYKNAVIYCDPPYKNTSQYDKKILGNFPYDEFIEWVKEQSKNNVVLVSEYKRNAPEDAKILLEINSRTDIKGKGGKQIPTVEVLWTYNEI
jgi:DNA adenine methylase